MDETIKDDFCGAGDELLWEMSVSFKVFGDFTRLKILALLLKETELPMFKIAETLGMTHTAISHQLATLMSARLLKRRRMGKNVLYSLADRHITEILGAVYEHSLENL